MSTTVAAIAEGSGIAVHTLYFAFGTKANILTKITRDWMAESGTAQTATNTLASPDPADRLRLFARM